MIYPFLLGKCGQNNQAAKEKGKLRIEEKDYVAGVLNISAPCVRNMFPSAMRNSKIRKDQSLSFMAM